MTDNGYGDRPVESQNERAALSDPYLEIVLGYSVEDYAAEQEPDEGGTAASHIGSGSFVT
jgi:hypothetical protein